MKEFIRSLFTGNPGFSKRYNRLYSVMQVLNMSALPWFLAGMIPGAPAWTLAVAVVLYLAAQVLFVLWRIQAKKETLTP